MGQDDDPMAFLVANIRPRNPTRKKRSFLNGLGQTGLRQESGQNSVFQILGQRTNHPTPPRHSRSIPPDRDEVITPHNPMLFVIVLLFFSTWMLCFILPGRAKEQLQVRFAYVLEAFWWGCSLSLCACVRTNSTERDKSETDRKKEVNNKKNTHAILSDQSQSTGVAYLFSSCAPDNSVWAGRGRTGRQSAR